ncbi:uncharacterized protein LOC125227182 isoform X2 [Leguminivora glycinivorella]|uniref:uncharacterized protein LOC125227182 isoform X2 n=1 Tax=Leguminivora glycinivorella TaxID=1035111 RepID=UPI002010567B|nr:uncharacterized protein LOC125227182 isoform X2 [Leguminivora glycinivorella]
MGKEIIYLIGICFYILVCVASVSGDPSLKAPKDNVIVGSGNKLKMEDSEDDGYDSGPADDDLPRNWRVLQSSDVLTPPELLPLAKRLIAKVDTVKPGEGTGVVSSAKSAENLADVLFQRFFMTDRRIKQISKIDIAGLDALQALALDGSGIHKNLKLVSVDGGRCYMDEFDKDGVVHNSMCYPTRPGHRQSIYSLLTKPINTIEEENAENRRQRNSGVPQSRIKLLSKLQKNRQIVVNGNRKFNQDQNKEAESMTKGGTKGPSVKMGNRPQTADTPKPHQMNIKKGPTPNVKIDNRQNVATSKPHDTLNNKEHLKGCRWKFECVTARNLDTCRLKTTCPGDKEPDVDHEKEKIHDDFRRMIGIASVDEEVEKIFIKNSKQYKSHVYTSSEESIDKIFY